MCWSYYLGVQTSFNPALPDYCEEDIVRKNAEPGQYFTLDSKEEAKVNNEENEADNRVWLRKRLAILQRWIRAPHPIPFPQDTN